MVQNNVIIIKSIISNINILAETLNNKLCNNGNTPGPEMRGKLEKRNHKIRKKKILSKLSSLLYSDLSGKFIFQ